MISSIHYTDYRNLTDCTVPFAPGMNVLWGMNAQGKSNILEGIYYFARGKSFRGAHDRELIRFGAPFARAELTCLRDGHELPTTLEAYLPRTGKKRFTKNGAPLSSVVELLGNVRAVLFCPAHLAIVTGGPLERRTLLDVALSQLSGAYLTHLRRYAKLLSDRNALIKLAAAGQAVTEPEWEVYAEQLSLHGAQIAAYRCEYVSLLAQAVTDYFSAMTGGAEVPTVTYQSHAIAEDDPAYPLYLTGTVGEGSVQAMEARLKERLTIHRERELAAGITLFGIQKDDIRLLLNGKEIRLYGSQGQQRSMVLAIKLAEGAISTRCAALHGGESPVYLLDDVFSELDSRRRAFLLEELGERQIIVTSCEPDVITARDSVHFCHVTEGTVVTENKRDSSLR